MKSDQSPAWEGFADYYCLPLLKLYALSWPVSAVAWAVSWVIA